MKKGKRLYSPWHKLSSVFMLLALLWLTVSIPFVYADQQAQKELKQKTAQQADDNTNPLSNTNEEKSESGVNTLSEYLHEVEVTDPIGSPIVTFYKCHPSHLYFAFHPELISPPPEA